MKIFYYVFRYLTGNCIKDMEFQNLKELTLNESYHINDKILSIFVEKCPQLEKIYFTSGFQFGFESDYCSKITNNGYRILANLKNLKFLHVDASKITYETLEYIAVNCNKLERIQCSNLKCFDPAKLIK